MKERKSGRIINIGSEVFQRSVPNFSAYVSAKGAQYGFSRSMAVELAPWQITVNLVAPGWIPVEWIHKAKALGYIVGSASDRTMTDQRGVFSFETLPFALFELRITTPDGRVVHGIQRSDPQDLDGTRFKIKLGKGYGKGIRVEATRERVVVDVPKPQRRWSKLWAELGIFVGIAGVLAL